MNQEALYDAFNNCLDALDAGTSLQACLDKYPQWQDELEPMLRTVLEAKDLSAPAIPREVLNRSRTRILGYAAQLRTVDRPARHWWRLPRMATAVFFSILVFLMSSGGLLAASAQSLPGDMLYPVKLAVENLQVQFVPGVKERQEIELNYTLRRVSEIEKLLAIGRVANVLFEGSVESITTSEWVVGGIQIEITGETMTTEGIRVGDIVEVGGVTQSGSYVVAQEIRLREYQLIGRVEAMNSRNWTIDGNVLEIGRNTQVDRGIQLGDQVIVLVRVEQAGSLVARAILRLPELLSAPTFPVTDLQQLTTNPTAVLTPIPSPTPPIFIEEMEIIGIVDAMSEPYWMIAGQVVYITAQTEIKDTISPGDLVQAHVIVESNGSLTAKEIELATSDDQDDRDNDDLESTDEPGDDGEDAEDENAETPDDPDDTSQPSDTPESTPDLAGTPDDEPDDTDSPEPTETPDPDD
jgi:hypothetical protein